VLPLVLKPRYSHPQRLLEDLTVHHRLWTIRLACVLGSLLLCVSLVPAVAAAERTHDIVPEDYFTLGTIAQCANAPDGQYIAYTEVRWGEPKERRTSDLWVVHTGTKARTRLTFERCGSFAPQWSPDSKHIYFGGHFERPGAEKAPWDGSTQVWRISPTGGELFPVTKVKGGISGFELSHNGKTLYYTVTEEHVDDEWKDLQKRYADLQYGHGIVDFSQLWKLDLESWWPEKIVDEQRVIRDFTVTRDEKRIAMITTPDWELVSHEGWSRLDVFDVESGKIAELTSDAWRANHPSPFGWIESPAWSSGGKALAFSISFDGYPTELHVAEHQGGAWQVNKLARPTKLAVAGGAMQWRSGTRDLYFLAEERARIRLYCFEQVRDGKAGQLRVVSPGDIVATAYDLDDKGDGATVVYSTTTHMRDIFRVDARGKYARITNVNPQVDTWKLPQVQLVTWEGANGDEVEGILELPPDYKPGDGPLPLVVELHGGPSAATYYRLRFWIYGRTLFPAKGYALLSPNYRGSTGYGDKFMTDLVGRENNIEVKDILEGVDAMVSRGIADETRLGVMGWSNGGLLTNCVITHTERFKAASSGAGIVDMVMQWGLEDTPGHVVNFMKGLPWETPEAYRHASCVYDLDKVTTPTLIHVGGADARVPTAHSKTLYRAFHRYLKVPTQLVIYPGEGHGLTTKENRLAKMEWDLAWFDKYLLGKDDAEE
jgi:dipeptidyl aminopeptidase/acylaminoacyl peptidase